MTSFEEYSRSTPASAQAPDYMYSYSGVSNQAYPTIYTPHPHTHSTSSGGYGGYGQNTHQDFVLDTNSVQQGLSAESIYHLNTPAHSPRHSSLHSFAPQPPVLSSTSDSGASIRSNLSSAIGSPSMSDHHNKEWNHIPSIAPGIIHQDNFQIDTCAISGFDCEPVMAPKYPGYVDPALIQPTSPPNYASFPFSEVQATPQQPSLLISQEPLSPVSSANSVQSNGARLSRPQRTIRATSPYQWSPYTVHATTARRPSVSSVESRQSHQSRNSQSSLDSSEEGKGVCPIPSCGRHIKDLKAHLLTHKNERPEKCPIPSCEYHMKGFARKYDKNRHTLTHYKGSMVCGFCPGSGSSTEKSFNRADVFKRHLTSVHGVDQTAPNSRKKNSGASTKSGFSISGACSTCGVVFPNAQDFYEHLDDCVLRVVQQSDPSEAINERILASIAEDKSVQETMERHMLSTTLDLTAPTDFSQEEEEDDEDASNKNPFGSGSQKQRPGISRGNSNYSNCSQTSNYSMPDASVSRRHDRNNLQGMTHSRGGVALNYNGKGNKRRKNYPLSWGAAPEKMHMKKRVMCVFDGPRRLWKDDMMLDTNQEVRITLPGGDGRRWVTDLDVQTLRRAEGLHGATEQEKGPWLDEDGRHVDFPLLMSQI
ncbi:hypothetical protein BDV97DRAFT_117481 [Delphinella strobiligena]|nr:hypothetical protein BDV97DRAFT_117481 [Delphinella strobiligena]